MARIDMKAVKQELDKMFDDYDLSKKGSGAPEGLRYIEVVVGLHIDEDSDPAEIIENVDYEFKHKHTLCRHIIPSSTALYLHSFTHSCIYLCTRSCTCIAPCTFMHTHA